jgi:hypothetical protein
MQQILSPSTTGKFAIAFFDILGFSERVKTNALSIVSNDYERMLESTELHIRPVNPSFFKTPQESFFPNHPYTISYCDKYIFSD